MKNIKLILISMLLVIGCDEDSELANILDDNSSECTQGDINEDNIINVIDIVSVVNLILEGGEPTCNSDINQDGIVNVIDIVALVNLILSS